MHRFFVLPEQIHCGGVILGAPQAHQIRDVLRLRCGEHITVLDNRGWEKRVRIKKR